MLTLNQARQTGASSSRSSSSPQLFGSGITPPPGGSGASKGSSTTRHASRVGHHTGSAPGAAATPAPAAPLPAAVLRASRGENSSGGSGSTLALVGGGLAVLVLGAFGGTVLRHSRRPTPSS